MPTSWQHDYPSFCVAAPDLNPGRVDLVRRSWAIVQQRVRAAAQLQGQSEGYFGERFYEILFERYPATKALFEDPGRHARELHGMLCNVVDLLGKDVDAVAAVLEQLASRHHRYGTRPEHYAPVGECMLAAITEVLGDDCDASTAEAWVHVYSTIATAMLPITHEMCMRDSMAAGTEE